MNVSVLDELDELEAAATPRLCLCGCQRLVKARSGPGRPSVYATMECRRSVEFRARKAGQGSIRKVDGNDPRAPRETLSVRVADPVKLAKGWFTWRYPESYRPSGDGRNPAGYRTVLGNYPGTFTRYPGFTVKAIWGSDIEITELARWVKDLPGYQQADLACRAVESRTGHHVMAESPDRAVSHGDILDRRPDPVTLAQLMDFYRPGECLEAGCYGAVHARGLCRECYDQFRR